MKKNTFAFNLLAPGHESQVADAVRDMAVLRSIDQNPNRQVNSAFVSPEQFAPTDLPPGYTPGNGSVSVQVALSDLQWQQLLQDVQGQYNFQQIGFSAVAAGALIRNAEKRNYILIQNTGAANLYVGFGLNPTQNNGLVIVPGGNYEPLKVPQNDIYIASASGTVSGVIVLATGQG
jgi:hypothetical protein